MGDTLAITYNDTMYELKVLELQPKSAVRIIECDMSVRALMPVFLSCNKCSHYLHSATQVTTTSSFDDTNWSRFLPLILSKVSNEPFVVFWITKLAIPLDRFLSLNVQFQPTRPAYLTQRLRQALSVFHFLGWLRPTCGVWGESWKQEEFICFWGEAFSLPALIYIFST